MNNLCLKYSINLESLESIEWKTQNSNSNSILFYTLADNIAAKEIFKSRINSTEFAYCIVNTKIKTNIKNIICVEDHDFLALQKEICDKLLPFENNFKSLCITGTNGKTTTVDLVRQICSQVNKNILTIGTLGVWKNEKCVDEFGLTSPTYIDFRKYLHKYSRGIDVLAVEMSSHALMQKRYYDFQFDYGAWTSFSQDHLDYHETMDEYFEAKSKIFNCVKETVSVIKTEKFITKLNNKKLKSLPVKSFERSEFLSVDYNKKNMTLALDLIERIGVNEKEIKIKDIKAPPGRFNILNFKENYIVIDFAHTSDALKNICQEIKKSFPSYQLITVFGCGGDRDKSKRPLMGSIAIENSDYVFVTSDNPRFEKPEDIINDIIVGLDKKKFQVEVDRKEAITKAMKMASKQIVLIAGKGHENYIDENGKKRPYNDEEVVKRIIEDDKC